MKIETFNFDTILGLMWKDKGGNWQLAIKEKIEDMDVQLIESEDIILLLPKDDFWPDQFSR